MQTHSGKIKKYYVYGFVNFTLNLKKYKLNVYQSETLLSVDSLKDYLFLPFTDLTNYKTTYGGGRYIDLDINKIVNNKIEIDFNKCYNPYCAFGAGYSCPIPPKENDLPIAIPVGEKNYRKK
jgi:uncharacterized protein